jgi:hypothetical protein
LCCCHLFRSPGFVRLDTTCKTGDTIYFSAVGLLGLSRREAASCKQFNSKGQPAPFPRVTPPARLATARVNTGNPKPLVASYQSYFMPRGPPSLDRVCCSSKRRRRDRVLCVDESGPAVHRRGVVTKVPSTGPFTPSRPGWWTWGMSCVPLGVNLGRLVQTGATRS